MATISGEVALMTSGDEVHRKADRCAGAKNRPASVRPLEALRGACHRDDRHQGVHHQGVRRLDVHQLDVHQPGEHRSGAHQPVVRRSAEGRSDGRVPALNSAGAGRSASPRAGGRPKVWAGRDGHPAADCPHSG